MTLTLPVMESFHSLQGEGAHAGKSAFFIRLGGCKVQCSWCDTKESWSFVNHPSESVLKLAQDASKAMDNGASFLVITGGEPLHHNLGPLCKAIQNKTAKNNSYSMPIHLETSGVNSISGLINWITLSPKKHLPPKHELLKICQEIKVIIYDDEDILFAEEMAKIARNVRKGSNDSPLLYLQPRWNSEQSQAITIEYVKRNPQWRLSMQTHKWLGVN